MPRNVHKSAINALILGGGVPVYVNPGVDKTLGISLGMSVEGVKEAMAAHPDAKAVFVNNPTYYGVCGHLEAIVALAHKAGMKVLVDGPRHPLLLSRRAAAQCHGRRRRSLRR